MRLFLAPAAKNRFGAIVAVIAFLWPATILVTAFDVTRWMTVASFLVICPLWAVFGARIAAGPGAVWLAGCTGWTIIALAACLLAGGTFGRDGEWQAAFAFWCFVLVPWVAGFLAGQAVRFAQMLRQRHSGARP